MNSNGLLTVAEAAEQLGITRYQVYRRIARGNLPAVPAQAGNVHYLISQADVDKYIAAGGAHFINPPRLPETDMMRVPEVAILTGFTAESIRRMCRDGTLPSQKGAGRKGQYRIPRSAVLEVLR